VRLVFNYRPVNHLALHKLGRRCIFPPFLSPPHWRGVPGSHPSSSSDTTRDPPFLSGQITPYDLRCNLQSAVRMYTAISPCKYATLFRMRVHSLHPPALSSHSSFFLFFSLLLPRVSFFLSLFLFLSFSLSFISHVPLRAARGKVLIKSRFCSGNSNSHVEMDLTITILPN